MKITKFLFSPVFMGILFILFAASMAAATFVENDYGSAASYNFVYDTRWFELILFLLAVNMTGQMIIFKLYRRSKLTIMLFHLSFILLIAGAAITRYTGWEGFIHIREGENQDTCYSVTRYLGYSLKDISGKVLERKSVKYYMGTTSADNFTRKINTGEKTYELVLSKILPNAANTIEASSAGNPVISLILSDSTNRETIIIRNGEIVKAGSMSVGLNPPERCDIVITTGSSSFYVKSVYPVNISGMMTRERKSVSQGDSAALAPMQVLSVNGQRLIVHEMELKGEVKVASVDPKVQNTGKNVLIFNVYDKSSNVATINVWNDESKHTASGSAMIDDKIVEITYGSEELKLPFALKLNDFVLERYPGSNSPSGYKSEVVLTDAGSNIEKPFSIYMNNILKFKGYRFYQSSYDQDEKGTVLSVNHDFAGMMVTYTGYAMLFLFIVLSLLNRDSVFHKVDSGYWSSALRKKALASLLFMAIAGSGNSVAQKLVADKTVADEFGNILVQDQKGRTKPLFTLSNDILRKVARENKLEGLTPMQVFLGIYFDFNNWKNVPMIRVSDTEVQKRLGIRGNMASFTDIVDIDGDGFYKLAEDVTRAYSKSPGLRDKTDKEIMKVDERVNIIYMVYSGGFLKIFPLHDGSHNWGTPEESFKQALNKEDSVYLKNIMSLYAEALQSGNKSQALQITGSVRDYQKKFAAYELPHESKLKAESMYYRLMIFERLFPVYATIGILMLAGLIFMLMKGRKSRSMFVSILGRILFAGFVLHTFGLGLRWYISGHSPMSNGYESMIFISWVTLLAGFIFSRKSPFALSATAVLAGLTLMVAHLSFMDPEITNLVPVLKSYWLTLHVSVITGSYAFLGLGAILAIISMMLITLSGNKNITRVSATLDELIVINYKSLTIGLYLLTIGTFLGAVWANESWGRYWGWDPKETWSLITIIIYSLVIHSRLIPGMKDIYSFNLLALFAFASVLMTYFGVNYYLSGLHSYAAGDPVPVPAFVYMAVIALVGLSVAAYARYRKWEKAE
ncbi:MAG TPA: c-type cytochrome biogenesis protein CcsB [Bacteroidales bacterium]|nr:c-type cytochrome biogenesis protein CcsB [Bacteroidales bacterium]